MSPLSSLQAEQPHAIEILSAALVSCRMHHAYILAGPAQAGADELAHNIVQSIMCTERTGADACGACTACRKVNSGNHPDLVWVVPDEKDNISIDTVRNACARLALRASEAPTKVAVVLQADAMKPPAQNALLKTLEEPPGSTCFVMTTTRLRMLLSTVRSRCQTIRLAPRRREGAWRVLSRAGIDEEAARPLGALVGPDPERAQALVDKGAPEIIARLRSALAPGAPLPVIIETAADLAADRERTDLALALIEVDVRDRLAHACGATPDHLLTQPASSGSLQHLSAAASQLQSLRRFKTLNINRSVALETVLFTLAGRFRPLVP